MKNIDIVDVKRCVKNGQLRSFVENGKIFLEDTTSGECVEIGTVSTAPPSQWVSVSDRLPDNVGPYLVYLEGGYGMDAATFDLFKTKKFQNVDDDGYERQVYVTHWMPLPTPPTKEERT